MINNDKKYVEIKITKFDTQKAIKIINNSEKMEKNQENERLHELFKISSTKRYEFRL
jgi:hypothetical protein